MTISKTTTNLSTLKINYLTEEQYQDALENQQINENEIYMTPGEGSIDATATPTTNKISKFDTNAKMNSTDMTAAQVEDFVENLDIHGGGGGGGGAGSLITGSVELTANGWSNNTQTVAAAGVTASNVVLVNPAPASYDDYVINNVRCTAQAENSLTFTCDFVPSDAITVNLIIAGAIQMYNGGVE